MSLQCCQFVQLINKLSTILSTDPASEALVLNHMKRALKTLKSINPEVYQDVKTVVEFFVVMAKYWSCYDDHDLLEMVIESTENEEAISVLKTFLRNRDHGMVIPMEKCPEAPFRSPCSDSKEKELTAGASTEMVNEDPSQQIEDTQLGVVPISQHSLPSERVCELPQDSLPPEEAESLQHFHHHPGCSNELPPNRVPVVADIDVNPMISWKYDHLKDVVATVLNKPKEALSLFEVYTGSGSCRLVWHVSKEIAAVIKKIQLSQDDQEMLLQCAVLTLSCDDKCLFEIAREELVSE